MSSSMFVKAMVLKYNALSMDVDDENEHIIGEFWALTLPLQCSTQC